MRKLLSLFTLAAVSFTVISASTLATADTVVFDVETVLANGAAASSNGTFNLGTDTLTFVDFGVSGVDFTVEGFDPLGTPDNLGRNILGGLDSLGVIGVAAGVAATEAITVTFAEPVLISQIVLGEVEAADDTVTLAGLSSELSEISFADAVTGEPVTAPVFSVSGSDLILDLSADNGDGDGLDLGTELDGGLVIIFDTPISSTGFTFTGDIDNNSAGIGINSITFNEEAIGLLGDVNLDGIVNFLDIAPFITLLSTQTFQVEADIDMNLEVNFLDISPFIVLLSGGSIDTMGGSTGGGVF